VSAHTSSPVTAAWAALKPVFETTLGARIGSDGTSLPMIALDLASRPRRGA